MTTYRWSLEEDVTALTTIDVPAIGLWRNKVVDFGEERAAELIRDSDLTVSSLSWAGAFTGNNGFSHLEAIADAKDAIRTASRLRARTLAVATGTRDGHIVSHADRMIEDALRELAPIADTCDVDLAITPMHPDASTGWTSLHSLGEAADLCDRIDHPRVRIALDTFHVRSELRLLDRIAQVGPFITLVQLGDRSHSCSLPNERCLLGSGVVPLDEILAAVSEAGYNQEIELLLMSERLWRLDYSRLIDQCRGFLAKTSDPIT